MSSIDDFVQYLTEETPKTILDYQFGNGIYGAIARTALDFNEYRFERGDWETIIVGITNNVRSVENPLYEFYSVVDTHEEEYEVEQLGGFDLVIVSNNLPKKILNKLKSINKTVIELC